MSAGQITGIVFGVIAGILIIAIVAVSAIIYTHRRVNFDANGISTEAVGGTVEFHKEEGKTPYLVKRLAGGEISDGDFKILATTDLHLSNGLEKYASFKADDNMTLTILSRLIEREKPDLVLLLGDVACGNKDFSLHKAVAEFFEKRNQYWGFVLGNHDGENNPQSAEELLADRKAYVDFFEPYEHCIVYSDDTAGFGSGNCVVNVQGFGGKILESIYLLDSGISCPRQFEGWFEKYGFEKCEEGDDFIKPCQIEWFRKRNAEIAKENGGEAVKSLVYFHIPLPEARQYSEIKYTENHIYGYQVEGCCASGVNSGFLDACVNLGTVEAISYGHEHDNDYCLNINGVKILYAQPLPYFAYNARKEANHQWFYKASFGKLDYFTDGCTIYMIHSDKSTDIVPKRNSDDKSVFDGLDGEFEEIGAVK